MALPGYDIKHVKASHRKYQIITIFFTIITLSATLGAAFSGIRLSSLKKAIPASGKMATQTNPPQNAPVISDDSAMKEIEALKSALSREKSATLKMKAKIKDLNNQISALKKAVVASKPSKPTAPQAVQPKPAVAPLPSQQKDTVTGSAPPPPTLAPTPQKAEPPPGQATESKPAKEPSALTPQQPTGASEGIAPPADSTSNPKAPATETVPPSVDTNENPTPNPETEQPPSVPPVKAPSVQPQSKTAPSPLQQPEAKNE
ncbi:MAG: hypothetical protein P8X96_13330 [Desulfobacteraceae bacterium]